MVLGGLAGVFGIQLWESQKTPGGEQLQAAAIEDLASSIESSVTASVGERMEVYLEQMKAESQSTDAGTFPTEELTTAIITKLEKAMATGEIQLLPPAAETSSSVDTARTDVAAIEFSEKQQPMELSPQRELQQIHFLFDSAELTPGAVRKTRLAAEAIAREQPSKIQIKGFSDTMGRAEYNEDLSHRRATSVAELLIAAGVPADIIEIQGMGDSALPEPTGKGVREPLNRCVSITAIQ